MGNLEMPTGEIPRPVEIKMPSEVADMDKNLVGEAKAIFETNHDLVKKAMFGVGSRKAKEVLKNLAECREQTKNTLMDFRKTRERIYH